MHFPTLIAALAMMSSGSMLVSAAPPETGFTKRAGSKNDPHILDIDCTNVPNLCEARCMAMLCFDVPNPYKYIKGKKHSRQNRQKSGANTAFKGTDAQRKKKGTALRPGHKDWTSAEDTVRGSAEEGGWGTPLVPVEQKENDREGALYDGQLVKQKVKSGEYVKDKQTGKLGKYCKAYQSKNPNKAVTCKSSNADDPINFIYWRTTEKKQNTYQFHLLKYGTDSWTKNRPQPPKKRDVAEIDDAEPVFEGEEKRDAAVELDDAEPQSETVGKREDTEEVVDATEETATTTVDNEKRDDIPTFAEEGFDSQAELDAAVNEASAAGNKE